MRTAVSRSLLSVLCRWCSVYRVLTCVYVTAVTSGSSSLGTLCDTPLQAQSSSAATTTPIDSPTDSTAASSAAVGSHRLPSRLVSLSLYIISYHHHHKLHTDRGIFLNLILKIPGSWKSWEKALVPGEKTWKITGKWAVVVWSSEVLPCKVYGLKQRVKVFFLSQCHVWFISLSPFTDTGIVNSNSNDQYCMIMEVMEWESRVKRDSFTFKEDLMGLYGELRPVQRGYSGKEQMEKANQRGIYLTRFHVDKWSLRQYVCVYEWLPFWVGNFIVH